MMKQKALGEWIDRRNVSFIASVDEQGFPNMKAMLPPRKREGLREFYFSTNTSSLRVSQYMKNEKASIYFYEKGRFHYIGVMFTGTMEVLQEGDIKKELWSVGDFIYYHGGVTDPDYCILKFTVQEGRYYSDFKSESFEIEK